MSLIEALYIFDEHNNLVLGHVYTGRPPPAKVILPLYLEQPTPRPSLIYLTETNPPSLIHSFTQDNLLFLSPTSSDVEPLYVLEFLHRVADALEDFVGSPLLASRIESSYDVVAQLIGEMCDAGLVANTEPNTLRDVVDAPTWVGKLLGGVGLPSNSPSLIPSGGTPFSLTRSSSPISPVTASPVPWRRTNVRHTSNEMYVDVVEEVFVILAPSGRPLSAMANGSIAFTAKVSGVPDILLNLSVPGGISSTLTLPVFHQCVRLAKWRERPGELSFVPPDGRFILAGYEVDLLGSGTEPLSSLTTDPQSAPKLNIPVLVEMSTSLGPTGTEFEARIIFTPRFKSGGSSSSSGSGFGSSLGKAPLRSGPAFGTSGTSAHPTVDDVVVTIPVPMAVRNITDLRSSRGEVQYAPGESQIEWRFNAKEVATLLASSNGVSSPTATLRGSMVGGSEEEEQDETEGAELIGKSSWDYDDGTGKTSSNQNSESSSSKKQKDAGQSGGIDRKAVSLNRALMPPCAMVSFQVKGWLPSGIKVDSLAVDAKRSRGLGSGVTPYKGVKYLTVSQKGVETRC